MFPNLHNKSILILFCFEIFTQLDKHGTFFSGNKNITIVLSKTDGNIKQLAEYSIE